MLFWPIELKSKLLRLTKPSNFFFVNVTRNNLIQEMICFLRDQNFVKETCEIMCGSPRISVLISNN